MTPRRSITGRAAFTLIEAAISCVIVAVMLTAALTTAGARARQQKAIDRQKALFLAQSLMSEILDKAYVDPGPLPLFGPELAELSAKRSAYNDVDDYNGLSESPPAYADGTAMSGYPHWSRSVTVAWVRADLTTTSLTETGLKKITVTVKRNGVTVMVLYACARKRGNAL